MEDKRYDPYTGYEIKDEESPQKIQKVDLVQIYESDQHIRAGKTGR